MSTVLGGPRTGGRGMRATLRPPLVPSTTPSALPAHGVSSVSLAEAFGNSLTERQLDVRRRHLAHRAPRTKSLHQLRRSLACGKVRAWHSLMATSLADLEDGAPAEAVAGAYELAASLIRARAREIAHEGAAAPSLLPAMLREGRKESAENEAEKYVLAEPDNVAHIDRLLAASAEEMQAQRERDADLRVRRAALTLEGR